MDEMTYDMRLGLQWAVDHDGECISYPSALGWWWRDKAEKCGLVEDASVQIAPRTYTYSMRITTKGRQALEAAKSKLGASNRNERSSVSGSK